MYFILGTNSENKVLLFGTPTGRGFTSEDAANRAATKLDSRYAHMDFLVVPVTELPGR
jgi:hypothetical protein